MCVCVSVGCGEYYTLLMYCTRAGIGLFFSRPAVMKGRSTKSYVRRHSALCSYWTTQCPPPPKANGTMLFKPSSQILYFLLVFTHLKS
jgi:hypothetical protein